MANEESDPNISNVVLVDSFQTETRFLKWMALFFIFVLCVVLLPAVQTAREQGFLAAAVMAVVAFVILVLVFLLVTSTHPVFKRVKAFGDQKIRLSVENGEVVYFEKGAALHKLSLSDIDARVVQHEGATCFLLTSKRLEFRDWPCGKINAFSQPYNSDAFYEIDISRTIVIPRNLSQVSEEKFVQVFKDSLKRETLPPTYRTSKDLAMAGFAGISCAFWIQLAWKKWISYDQTGCFETLETFDEVCNQPWRIAVELIVILLLAAAAAWFAYSLLSKPTEEK